VSRSNSGFASMSPQRRREVASRGGVAAHVKGTAHEWTQQEAREASLKGRRQPRARDDDHRGYRGQRPNAPMPAYVVPDAEPQSPWLESLRKNLEDLFATQKRVATGGSSPSSVDHFAV